MDLLLVQAIPALIIDRSATATEFTRAADTNALGQVLIVGTDPGTGSRTDQTVQRPSIRGNSHAHGPPFSGPTTLQRGLMFSITVCWTSSTSTSKHDHPRPDQYQKAVWPPGLPHTLQKPWSGSGDRTTSQTP
jgi:hypothetical protein